MEKGKIRVRRKVPLAGAEDIAIDHAAEKAYIAAQDRWNKTGGAQLNGIYVLDLGNDTALPERMPSDLPDDFRGGVRGLSLFIDGSGTRRLFVVHDRGNADYAVEVLDVHGNELRFVRAVADAEHLTSCNDLVALNSEQFYVTNDHGTRQPFWQNLETLWALPLSTAVFYDGNRFHTVARNIEMANGIALDRSRKRLYVASTRMKRIYQYAWNPNQPADEIANPVSIELPGCPDNLEWDEDGNLWVAADPSFSLLAAYVLNTPLLPIAPSLVLRLSFEDVAMPSIDRVFEDRTGREISASSVAAVHGRGAIKRLLIGAPFDDHFLDCELVES
jgi:arylesterase / paraoxonase